MTQGLYARRYGEGEREVDRARAAVVAVGAERAAASASPHVAAILGLQRSAGNRAVSELLRSGWRATAAPAFAIGLQRYAHPSSGRSVQRQDEEEWGTDEAAAGSEWSSGGGEQSSAGSEWSSGGGEQSSGGGGESSPGSESAGGGGGQSSAEGPAAGYEEAPASEPESGGGESAGSEWAGGGGAGGGGGGEGEAAGSGEEEGGGSSWWPFGGEETPRNEPGESAPGGDDGGGSSWWPFGGGGGGGEEAPGGGDGGDGGGSSWWPFGGEDTPRNEPGEEDPGERSEEDVDHKIAEGESGSEKDVFVPMGGGPNPIAKTDSISAAEPGGFHDGGNAGTVPVGSRADDEDPAEAMNPRAFIRGGQTGTIAWAGGGGEGLGPKGNQGSGSLQSEIEPDYDYHWGGPATNASSFVVPSTGVVDVHRSYITSKRGDQGNGWWVSDAASNALTAHEQKHVARAKDVYDRILEPMTVKIANSATYGKEKEYLGSKAKAALRAHIDWANTLKKFKDEDQAENAPNNRVDNEDVGAPHYPVPMKDPRVIEGKQYEHWEVMQGEKPPP